MPRILIGGYPPSASPGSSIKSAPHGCAMLSTAASYRRSKWTKRLSAVGRYKSAPRVHSEIRCVSIVLQSSAWRTYVWICQRHVRKPHPTCCLIDYSNGFRSIPGECANHDDRQ